MSILLTRVDYVNVGVTSRGTTCVFASETKQSQKFAVADHDGVLHIFCFKKGELQVLFKSLPGPKINRIVMGGMTSMPKDKIFLAHGNTVVGYTKKGKLFLKFETGLIDSITALYVLGSDLAACARDLYHRYRECKDADSYLIGEKLYDVVLVPIGNTAVLAVLACGDCAIRVLRGTKNPSILRLASIPTILSLYREGDKESHDRILMGTIDGKVGLLMLDNEKNIRISWVLTKMNSEITALDSYEIQDSLDLIIGRQDGSIEVYTLPSDEDILPLLRFRYNAGESISSVIGGIISSDDCPELLVTTYSGKVFGLTSKSSGFLELNQGKLGINKLKFEIQQLQEELKKEYMGSLHSEDTLSPLILSVNHRLILNKEDASYTLLVELDRSIDNILIQSDTPIELLDVEGNNAVMSLSTCNHDDGNFLLATYRCQDNTNRLEIKLRSIEGQPGTLQVYVTSQIQPKCCRKLLIPICALSLHTRLFIEDNESISGPFNELRLIGGFTLAEMHAWLAFALFDVPERPLIEEGSEAIMIYTSTLIGTILKCKYKKGTASFFSENISTIIILRDILTKKATQRKIKLEVFCDIADDSITKVLELILPKLTTLNELVEKINILDTLDTWEMKNNPADMCTEYQNLIKNESDLRQQMTKSCDALQRLHAIITDLYVDWERAKGSRRISSKQASEKLHSAIESMDMALLLQAFIGKDMSAASVSVPVLL
ncbi:PREDICTED: Bardet-Biedl syndrome 7 protein homolog [Ceratosolen solmsi marchali]|uniref:Bardet-Biedl syndrome 7 protein homolog n=1 Tax=Ceratosolen solmsi marchali TaxID=326594 RepID=A0AAJ6YI41_9HYME|nr:PREDICTED: Bardet-Biedl syndrome 7 protein homolog [Ceratosolen solmsi marchali]